MIIFVNIITIPAPSLSYSREHHLHTAQGTPLQPRVVAHLSPKFEGSEQIKEQGGPRERYVALASTCWWDCTVDRAWTFDVISQLSSFGRRACTRRRQKPHSRGSLPICLCAERKDNKEEELGRLSPEGSATDRVLKR